MSVAFEINELNAFVTEGVHSDTMTLVPMNLNVLGYLQEASEEFGQTSVKQFHFAKDLVTHKAWVRRDLVKGVDLKAVSTITFFGRNYRVKHVTDDPNYPDVAFSCVFV